MCGQMRVMLPTHPQWGRVANFTWRWAEREAPTGLAGVINRHIVEVHVSFQTR